METYTFTFSKEMAATIANLLSDHPYKVVAPILVEMQRQVDAQVQASAQANTPVANGKGDSNDHSIPARRVSK